MKRRNLSLLLGFVLSFSMFFIGTPIPLGNGMVNSTTDSSPASSSSISNIGVVEGDVIYYHFMNEYSDPNEEQYDHDSDNGIVRVEVREINASENKIYYDFYFVNKTESSVEWNWDYVNDEMGNDSARWLEDDFTHEVFNHSIVFPNNITDMQAANASENLDQLIMDSFNASLIYSEYSDAGSEWNTVYFEVYPDDGDEIFSVLVYVNKTTGLMTYYEETQGNHTFILELAGFDLLNYNFEIPDSFGVVPGDWIDRFSPVSRGGSSGEDDDKWGYYPDWLEPNDYFEDATDLNAEFGAGPGTWHELNTYENDDYYQFYANNGDTIQVYVNYEPSADVVLYTIDSLNGAVIEQTIGEQDPGWESLSWTATYDGMYYIKINGSDGFWGDKYEFGISINGDWGPDYWPDEGSEDDHNDGGFYIHEYVEFVFTNPYTQEDVLIIDQSEYKFPTMLPEDCIGIQPMRVVSRVPVDNPNIQLGEAWFHKDIDFTTTDFLDWFDLNFIQNGEFNFSTYSIDSDTDWVKFVGIIDGTTDKLYFFAQKLPGIGTVQFYTTYIESDDDPERKYQDMIMTIDCSVPGVIKESDPTLGVSEGDWWTYVVQSEERYDEWGSDNDYHYYDESVLMATFTVTHIFALNLTTMGVVGSMEVQIIHNDGSIDPEKHVENFAPLLVYDTNDPVSFITMGGLGDLEGPPVLLPMVADWTTQETAMLNLFNSMPNGPGSPIAYKFQTSTIRFRFDGRFDDSWPQDGGTVYAHRDWQQDITLDVNDYGMTTYLNQRQHEHEDWSFVNGGETINGGRDKEERFVAFMVNGSKGCEYETDIASITALNSLDSLIWERSESRPAGEWGSDDPGSDPADKSFEKVIIGNVVSTCDNYVVFLGAQFWKGPNDTDFHPHEWHLNTSEEEIIGNYWYLGSIRKNDIWTWIESQIFDMSITDFAPLVSDIVELLNYAFAPKMHITTADITTNGRSFTISAMNGTIKHEFRLAVNSKGIMQDLFSGEYDTSTDTWIRWERNVLVEAPSGYEVGEFFMDDIPPNYVPSSAYNPPVNTTTDDTTTDDTTTDDTATDDTATDDTATDDTAPTNPFENIPGYTTSAVLIFSLIGVVALTLRKRR
ncbi:MAG: hypothetical protein K9W44_00855 [Candidatus Lokiarchaeota archaeon]|nr:hypothetical protein [Candidatus Harpocratesius repetitus]